MCMINKPHLNYITRLNKHKTTDTTHKTNDKRQTTKQAVRACFFYMCVPVDPKNFFTEQIFSSLILSIDNDNDNHYQLRQNPSIY